MRSTDDDPPSSSNSLREEEERDEEDGERGEKEVHVGMGGTDDRIHVQ